MGKIKRLKQEVYVEMLIEELRRVIEAETKMRGTVPLWAPMVLRIIGRIDDASK